MVSGTGTGTGTGKIRSRAHCHNGDNRMVSPSFRKDRFTGWQGHRGRLLPTVTETAGGPGVRPTEHPADCGRGLSPVIGRAGDLRYRPGRRTPRGSRRPASPAGHQFASNFSLHRTHENWHPVAGLAAPALGPTRMRQREPGGQLVDVPEDTDASVGYPDHQNQGEQLVGQLASRKATGISIVNHRGSGRVGRRPSQRVGCPGVVSRVVVGPDERQKTPGPGLVMLDAAQFW